MFMSILLLLFATSGEEELSGGFPCEPLHGAPHSTSQQEDGSLDDESSALVELFDPTNEELPQEAQTSDAERLDQEQGIRTEASFLPAHQNRQDLQARSVEKNKWWNKIIIDGNENQNIFVKGNDSYQGKPLTEILGPPCYFQGGYYYKFSFIITSGKYLNITYDKATRKNREDIITKEFFDSFHNPDPQAQATTSSTTTTTLSEEENTNT